MSQAKKMEFFKRAIAVKLIQIKDCEEKIAQGKDVEYYSTIRSWYIDELEEYKEMISCVS